MSRFDSREPERTLGDRKSFLHYLWVGLGDRTSKRAVLGQETPFHSFLSVWLNPKARLAARAIPRPLLALPQQQLPRVSSYGGATGLAQPHFGLCGSVNSPFFSFQNFLSRIASKMRVRGFSG